MNRRQQKYFLLGMILVSFLLLGQTGVSGLKDCFGLEAGEKRSIHSLADEYYDIDVEINEFDFGMLPDEDEYTATPCSGGTVTPMAARVPERDGVGTFTVTPGGCKSMSVYVGNWTSADTISLAPLSSGSVVGTTITFRAAGVDLGEIVDLYLVVFFFDDCTGKYPLSDDCEVDEETSESEEASGDGGTPMITDGEVAPGIDELPEDEVHPEPEPDLEPIGTACWASGAACSPAFSTDSRCCSGYCADGGCL